MLAITKKNLSRKLNFLILKDEDAVVDRIGHVNFRVVPCEPGWALELAGRGAEAAERGDEFALARELLHAVIPAVFADVEILRGVLADADRILELARSRAALPEVAEPVSVRIEIDDLYI